VARDGANDEVELVWEGWASIALRPMAYGTLRKAVDGAVILYLVGALAGLPLALGWVEVAGVSQAGFAIAVAVATLTAIGLRTGFRRQSLDDLGRRYPPIAVFAQISATPLIMGLVLAAGPALGVVAVYSVEVLTFAFFFFQPRWAVGIAAYVMAGYGVALAIVDGTPAPVEQWLIVAAAAVATAYLAGQIARQTDEARQAERAAKGKLADLNRTLEERVESQVQEIERAGRLRRFLAPQVAEVVLSDDSESLLEPHQREVGVLFCDLRGFTRFTNGLDDPHTVVGVLGEYYATVGAVLETHGATIGGFDGDGIMAYLGDPIALDRVAARTGELARDIGACLDDLTTRWRTAGHDLGYGIGAAHGPATLGVVGFDGRYDYTPLGAVVNLAARLCADAAHGEIVVDGSMRPANEGERLHHRGDISLKGFDAPIPTYALAR
jgi:class 3 adenylate cyclase